MTGDWRDYRPAIWLAMLGLAVVVVVNPYAGALALGAAIGITGKIATQRRRRSRGAAPRRRPRR